MPNTFAPPKREQQTNGHTYYHSVSGGRTHKRNTKKQLKTKTKNDCRITHSKFKRRMPHTLDRNEPARNRTFFVSTQLLPLHYSTPQSEKDALTVLNTGDRRRRVVPAVTVNRTVA